MIVPVMAIPNLVLTRQIYSEETNGAHAHYREPVPLKCLCFTFHRGCKKATRKLFLFLNLHMVLRSSTPGGFAFIWQCKQVGMTAKKIKRTRINFFFIKNDVSTAVDVVVVN